MDEYNNTIAGGVRFWLLGESLGDGRETLGVGKTVRAGRGFGFSLVANGVTDMGELRTSEGSREVEDEKLGKSSTEVTSWGYIGSSSHFSLLQRLLAGSQDRVGTVGQEVTSNSQHKDLGGINERYSS